MSQSDDFTFLEFPVDGKAKTWSLSERQIASWAVVYPALNVHDQMMRAWTWVQANPAKRKTARGMPRFLVAWLNRASDRSKPLSVQVGPLDSGVGRRGCICPHEPRCSSMTECTRLIIEEGRRERGES